MKTTDGNREIYEKAFPFCVQVLETILPTLSDREQGNDDLKTELELIEDAIKLSYDESIK